MITYSILAFCSDPVPGIRRGKIVAVSGTTRRTDVRSPRLLRSILPVHQRHTDTGTVRQRSAIRWQRRRLPPLQLSLGRRLRQPQSRTYVDRKYKIYKAKSKMYDDVRIQVVTCDCYIAIQT